MHMTIQMMKYSSPLKTNKKVEEEKNGKPISPDIKTQYKSIGTKGNIVWG